MLWYRMPGEMLSASVGFTSSVARPPLQCFPAYVAEALPAIGAAATLPRWVLLLTSSGKGLTTSRSIQPGYVCWFPRS